MLSLEENVNDFICMNEAGDVLALCEKYYAKDVCMLNEGEVFARSMRESFNKQKEFVDNIKESRVTLISKAIDGDVVRLVFHYKMANHQGQIFEFTGEHLQYWQDGKIIKEEYKAVK